LHRNGFVGAMLEAVFVSRGNPERGRFCGDWTVAIQKMHRRASRFTKELRVVKTGGLLLLPTILSLLWVACASPSSSKTLHTRPSDRSPLQMLEEAGRICCDAETFEAVGTMEVRSPVPSSNGTVAIRWVFGPIGEFRFERGPVTLVFDTEYSFVKKADTNESGAINMRAGVPEDYPLKGGPHNRYHGDMIMATGMVAIGMTYPEAAARLFGKGWAEAYFLPDDTSLRFGPDESVCGHPCRKIVGHSTKEDGQVVFWIDVELGVLRKWRTGDARHYMWIEYDRIRINPKLGFEEFRIPEDARKKADAEKN
jgi:hypothetical protein